MTPFELDILLHYYGHADDHPVVNARPPIWEGTLEAFLSEGLLEGILKTEHGATIRLTDRGRAYIDYVLAVPLPVRCWKLPDMNMLAGIRFPERCGDSDGKA